MTWEHLRRQPEVSQEISPKQLWQEIERLFDPEFVNWLRKFPNLAKGPVRAEFLPLHEKRQLAHHIGNPGDPLRWRIFMAANYSSMFSREAGRNIDRFEGALTVYSPLAFFTWCSRANTQEEARTLTLENLISPVPGAMLEQIPGSHIQFSRRTNFTQPTVSQGILVAPPVLSTEQQELIASHFAITSQEGGLRLDSHWPGTIKLSYPILESIHYKGPFKGLNGLGDFSAEA